MIFEEEYCVDEVGHIWLISDDGKPYSGPFDTIEDAEQALRIETEQHKARIALAMLKTG